MKTPKQKLKKEEYNHWIEIRNENTRQIILATWLTKTEALTIREIIRCRK